MAIHTFSDLLDAARSQHTPQKLLLVFARAELPGDSTAMEKDAFERGEGGALSPVVCVEKPAAQVTSFEALKAESLKAASRWDILFVAAVDESATGDLLKGMVEAIRTGRIANFLTVDWDGALVQLQHG